MTLELLPGYQEDLPPEPETKVWLAPIRPVLSSNRDIVVDTLDKADRFLSLLHRVNIGAIAFDTEFSYRTPSVSLRNGMTWQDPRSLEPLVLSLAIWIPDRKRVLRSAWDLRVGDIDTRLEQLFRLQAPFVAHFVQAELHTLWALGLDPLLHQVWDTFVAAKALDLGRRSETGFSLLALCKKYEIQHPFSATKEHLQRSFLEQHEGLTFTDQQFDYAMSDAEATLHLYFAQQSDILQAGLATHLYSVEFPFAIANARMIWDGVPIDVARVNDLRRGLDKAIEDKSRRLVEHGLTNPRSPTQVMNFLKGRGHEAQLKLNGKPSTDDTVLERLEYSDPIVSDIRLIRRYGALRADPLFEGDLIGIDGRLHPNHRHLGAATGRSSCAAPNIVGISKTFRPIVVAPEGRALLELDYAQIEVCVAAAVHGDPDLLAAANSEDVYAAMAQKFYADTLTPAGQDMPLAEFKSTYSHLRDQMKVFVLGIIYGMSAQGIADRFGISLREAQQKQKAFFCKFPGILAAMQNAYANGKVSGVSTIMGGLRRHIGPGSQAKNQHINTPVQGAAGVLFRRAVADLHVHFRSSLTQLVLPIHDAVLFECDIEAVEQVAQEAAFIMRQAVQRYFPELSVKVDVNKADGRCWNKDGRSDSLMAFVEDPGFKL